MAAALTMAGGGAAYTGFGSCDAVCQDAAATAEELSGCILGTDAFNKSGDGLSIPYSGRADPDSCDAAADTFCTLFEPSSCAICP